MPSLQETIDRRQQALDDLPKTAKKEFESTLAFLLERVKENTPVATGELRDSVRTELREADGRLIGEIVAGNAQVNYATIVHEDTSQSYDNSQPEGGRGPKYITRTVRFHQGRLSGMGKRILERIFTNRRTI